MPKAGELDWSHLTKSQPQEEGFKNPHKGGEKIKKSDIERDTNTILSGFKNNGVRQATDQELFGHLVVPEEKIAEAKENWENTFQNFYAEANKPIDNKTVEWGTGKMIDWDSLSEEEKIARNLTASGDSFED